MRMKCQVDYPNSVFDSYVKFQCVTNYYAYFYGDVVVNPAGAKAAVKAADVGVFSQERREEWAKSLGKTHYLARLRYRLYLTV